jgi:excisionase family DNA binding protein
MDKQQRPERLVTVREAEEQLGIRTTTAYKFIKDGVLEVVRFSPRCTRVKQSSIDRLIEHGLPQRVSA